jgi:hypothetical protein
MKTVEIQVYEFDELTDAAKETARNWWRKSSEGDTFYSESVTEDLCQIAPLLGIDIAFHSVRLGNGKTRQEPSIWWSGFWSQGDGACFEGTWRASAVQPGKLREFAPLDEDLHRIAEAIEKAAKDQPFLSIEITHNYRYYFAKSVNMEERCFDNEDNNLAENEALWPAQEAAFKLAQQALWDLMDWLYRTLEKEYEYHNADEQIDESIRCNDYEFTEDGERFVV